MLKPKLSPSNIGPQVRARCADLGFTLTALAEKIDVHLPSLHRMITKGENAKSDTLIALASALNCKVDDLLLPVR